MESFLKESGAAIEKAYAGLCLRFPDLFRNITEEIEKIPDPLVQVLMQYLYASGPLSDAVNYPVSTYLDYAENGARLLMEKESVRSLPEEIFLQYVLCHRVNEEEILPCRKVFSGELEEKVKGKSGKDAAILVNYWCAASGTYQADDARTLSALAFYKRGFGRCGEESVFCVNAMRSVGIPARQVYVPRWSHCDDNHAWVEVYAEGRWQFTGACEPLMILNRGWFSYAAARAMLVHSRFFGPSFSSHPFEGEDVIGKEGGVTVLNQTSRYARTHRVHLLLLDAAGNPAPGERAEILILNGSEFVPVAELVSDDKGECSITMGYGDLRVLYAGREFFVPAGEKDFFVLKKKEEESSQDVWHSFEIRVPEDGRNAVPEESSEQKKQGRILLGKAAEHLRQKRAAYRCEDKEAFLAGPCPEGLSEEENMEFRELFMDCLSEKDQTDCKKEVLEEEFLEGIRFRKEIPEEDFAAYVQSPRIELEPLYPYRKVISEGLSEEEKERFRAFPEKIWDWIENHISSYPDLERTSVTEVPGRCFASRMGSERAKRILFAAIARTLGIPAELCRMDGSMRFKKDGSWQEVLPQEKKTCTLTLEDGGGTFLYGVSWTIAKYDGSQFHTLNLYGKEWKDGKVSFLLPAGRYRIITDTRAKNGNILAMERYFTLREGETCSLKLEKRALSPEDLLCDIPLGDFALPGADEDGCTVTVWIREKEEPSQHILNELLAGKEVFSALGGRLYLLFEDGPEKERHLQDPLAAKVLEALPEASAVFANFLAAEPLERRLYVNAGELPLVVVRKGSSAVYASSGYRPGLGAEVSLVLSLLNSEKRH